MDTLLLLIFFLILVILPFSYFCYGEYKMWKYKKEVEIAEQEQEKEEELSWLKQRLLSFFTSRNLRAVSLYNYQKNTGKEFGNIYSVKLDVGNDNGFKFYRFNGNDRCGDIIDEPTKEDYEHVLAVINDIVTHEKDIPSNIKRNILVTLSR